MRTITVGGKNYGVKATALTPRFYRRATGRDMMVDFAKLSQSLKRVQEIKNKNKKQIAELEAVDLEMFENIAWAMVKSADKTIPDSPDEWLDTIDGMFPIYEAIPQLLEEWQESFATTAVPRKN